MGALRRRWPAAPLAEELGAARGSVADIYLPDWFSQRIPLFGGGALILGLVLNLWGWLGHRREHAAAG